MKPKRLSTRLGIGISLMSALLVVLLAVLAYFSLAYQLDARARQSLAQKLIQIRHSLAETASFAALRHDAHALQDQVLGHDNLSLELLDPRQPGTPAVLIGRAICSNPPSAQAAAGSPRYQRCQASNGDEPVSLTQFLSLQDGQRVLARLSLDRRDDQALLRAFIGSVLTTLPILLLLIGLTVWWVVYDGLKPLRGFRRLATLVSARNLGHRLEAKGLPGELSELAEDINLMLHRLDYDVRQLTQFSDDLAHELRTPLNNLMGKAQVTLSRERRPEEYKQVLEDCTEELERLARMVSQMLFLANVSQPPDTSAFTLFDLRQEVDKVVELFSLSAEERGINLVVEGQGHLRGDCLMVQRALSNLLSNALRHSPADSPVHIRIKQEDGQVRLSVCNRGEAIAESHLPHVFDRFYRVHASRSRQQGGSGLGLAIVRSIMSLHQGDVQVQSQPGQDTCFHLLFPEP